MHRESYTLIVETPNGDIKLEVNRSVIHEGEENMSVTLVVTFQGNTNSYQAETTEDALMFLANSLPENWHIKSCLSCRFGHFCPAGDYDNELFCVTDFEPKTKSDLWHVTENDIERKNRSRTLFECCQHYKKQSEDYFTYSDYLHKIQSK